MKLAINATMLGEKPTGSGVYSYNILKQFSKMQGEIGDVTVYTACPDGLKGLGLNIKEVSRSIMPSYNKKAGIMRFIWAQMTFPKEVKKKYDLVYNMTHHGSLYIPNQVLTVLDLLPVLFPGQNKIQSYYFKKILPRIAKRSKRIIVISNSTKADVIKYLNAGQDKVSTVLCGYDNIIFFPRADAIKIIKNKYNIEDYILVVGASYPHKNIERVINAYSTLKTDTKLVITGSGKKEYREQIEKLIEVKVLKHKVIILDNLASEDLPNLYSAAKVFVFASLYEGFGMPTLEAMACGTPAIISNTSSFPEVGGDAAYYIDPYNEMSIAGAIKEVLDDYKLRNELVNKGLERVKLFSWEKTAKEIIKILREAAG